MIQYPPDIANDPELLPHLQDKLHEGNFCIRIDMGDGGHYFKVLIPTMAFPEEVVLKVLHKQSSTTGRVVKDEEKYQYFLKVAGREEYLLGQNMLSQFNVSLNSLRAKFCRGNTNVYLHFMSLLHIDMTQVLKILPQVRPGLTYPT